MNIFNLLHDPWVPVVLKNGAYKDVGLRELLVDGRFIRDIDIDPPIAYAGVLRIALAILMRSHGAPLAGSAEAWRVWTRRLAEGGPDEAAINLFAAEWGERFWLLGERPFLQDPRLTHEAPKAAGTNKLRFDQASGNNALFWTKVADNDAPKIGHAEAARWLLVQWFYGAGGMCASRNGKSVGVAGPLRSRSQYFIHGANFWETLLTNAVRAPGDVALAARDAGWWEVDVESPRYPGTLTRLTGSPRGVLLVGDSEGVSAAHLTWGASLTDSFFEADPYTARILEKDTTDVRPYQAPGLASEWKDSPALLSSLGSDLNRKALLEPPAVFELSDVDVEDAGLMVITHYYAKKGTSKDINWSRTLLPDLLRCRENVDPVRYGAISQFVSFASAAIDLLRSALRRLNLPLSRPTEVTGWRHAEARFWNVVHGTPWVEACLALSRDITQSFADAAGDVTGPRRLMGVVRTEAVLGQRMAALQRQWNLVPENQPQGDTLHV